AKMEIPSFIPGKIENEYIEIKTKLQEENILEEIDEPAFNIMMCHYGLAVEVAQILKEQGPFQKDRKTLRKNPALQIFRENSNAFESYARRLGLFPEIRANMINEIEWERLRMMILQRDPICKDCNSQASTTVDHIIPVSQGGTDDMDNLQGLCEKCHNRKAAKEKKDFRWFTKRK
ncbi:unnamed protein product, partial [marine sediment metagenome]